MIFLYWWAALVVRGGTEKPPRDFSFLRSRWSCATIVLLLWEERRLSVGVETIRRWLHREQMVLCRPCPVLGPKDPAYAHKLGKIRHLPATLPADETVVFQDEVDINTNPKSGSMWMFRGRQAEVATPGTDVKRYLAGALHWRTGKLLVSSPGTQRNADLFVCHLDDLRQRLRGSRRLRQRRVSQLRQGAGIPRPVWLPHGAALFAHVCPRNQPDRTCLVALA